MNMMILIGIVLGGGTVAFDHLVRKLPHWLAVMLLSTAMILILAGMIVNRKAGV